MEELERFGGHAICLTTDVSNNNTSGAVFGTSVGLEYSEKLLDGNDLGIKAFSRFAQAQKFLHLEKPGRQRQGLPANQLDPVHEPAELAHTGSAASSLVRKKQQKDCIRACLHAKMVEQINSVPGMIKPITKLWPMLI